MAHCVGGSASNMMHSMAIIESLQIA